MTKQDLIESLVNRFLAVKVPLSVCADTCAVMKGYKDRTGTNFFTADESRQIFTELLDGELGDRLERALAATGREEDQGKDVERVPDDTWGPLEDYPCDEFGEGIVSVALRVIGMLERYKADRPEVMSNYIHLNDKEADEIIELLKFAYAPNSCSDQSASASAIKGQGETPAVTPAKLPSKIPEGFALVPITPTQAMLDAGGMVFPGSDPSYCNAGARDVWDEMLDAGDFAVAGKIAAPQESKQDEAHPVAKSDGPAVAAPRTYEDGQIDMRARIIRALLAKEG